MKDERRASAAKGQRGGARGKERVSTDAGRNASGHVVEDVTDSRGEENGSRWRREEYETEGTKWVDGDVIKNKTCPLPGIKKKETRG